MSSLLEIKRIVKQNKDLLDIISNYFDSNGINAQQKLFNYIEMYAIDRRASDFRKFIHIFYRFGMYYTRKPDFVTKIEQIFVYYKNTIKQFFKNKELFEFIRNRLMLLIMIQNEIIELNESIINLILTQKDSVFQKSLYFYPEIKPFISEEQRTKIENDLLQIDPEILTKFDEKRKIGENDGYLYSLIRKDSLKEFVICMHSNEIKATSIVKPSLFESNSFLYHYDNQTTLIEYAAYFGSTKIFIYLFKKYAIRPKLLWDYATHGRNPQIIHFLEDNEILKDFTYQSCMENAMKFYHNDIANYILNNLLQDTIEDKYKYKKNIVCYAFHYLNFAFLSDDLSEKWVLHYACQYNYPILVRACFHKVVSILLKDPRIKLDLNPFTYSVLLKEIDISPAVTKIEPHAFQFCTVLEKVTISSSVKSIGNSSFLNCVSLKQILIPSSVTEIGEKAFEHCSSLSQVSILSDLQEINNSCFCEAKSLKQINIPASVKRIGQYAFEECSSLEQISIPSSVERIEIGAFSSCKSLKQVIISSPITEIESYVFNGCTSLKQILFCFPESITKIGSSAFCDCWSLTELTVLPNITEIEKNAFKGCVSLNKVTIPSSVLKIDDYGFNQCKSLKQIIIPSSVKEVGANCFEDCLALEKVDFEVNSSLTQINQFTFRRCSSLKEINIPPSVKQIEFYAFDSCSSLKHLEIPPSVNVICEYAFNSCLSLESIQFLSKATLLESLHICDYAFRNDKKLSQITMDPSCVECELYSFQHCNSLNLLKIDSHDERLIFNYEITRAIYDKIKRIVISPNVETITKGALRDFNCLTELVIPNSVNCIESNSFDSCLSLKKVRIPPVSKFESYAFNRCKSLEEVAFDYTDSLNEIGSHAFFKCKSLKKVLLPPCITKICSHCFFACRSLTSIYFDVILRMDERNCLEDPFGVFVQSSEPKLVEIEDFAFAGCRSLPIIKIPSSVEVIGKNVFNDCSSLDAVVVPPNVKVIDQGTFKDCKSLSKIQIPSSLIEIKENAFENCSSLQSKVEIPPNVSFVGDGAFLGCTSLNEISIPSSLQNIGIDAFPPQSNITKYTAWLRIVQDALEINYQ